MILHSAASHRADYVNVETSKLPRTYLAGFQLRRARADVGGANGLIGGHNIPASELELLTRGSRLHTRVINPIREFYNLRGF